MKVLAGVRKKDAVHLFGAESTQIGNLIACETVADIVPYV